MKTGRPAKASTIYKVSIHNNGGRKYASTQPYTVDDNGKKHYTHKHWGIVDDDMRFHPNSTYFYAPIEERQKFITPFVGEQITICDAFGFEVPEGCRPTYMSGKSAKGKRGRPPKPQVETS